MSKRKRYLSFQELEARFLLAAVNIPDDLVGAPAAQVAAPVNIDNAAGVRAAEIRLQYDTELLDLTAADVTAGSVWAGLADTQVTANVDDATGTVIVFVSSATALPSGAGSLVQFNFTIAGNAVPADTAILDLTKVILNESTIPVVPAPASGPDVTDGVITVTVDNGGGTANVSGYAYADVNNNNTPDVGEGIPGVVITLVNNATGAQQQTTTAPDGRYQFSDVADGSYSIRQQQPVAYLEGGVNELSIMLNAGQTLADQNFREAGLLPQFVYNRLHTTLVQPVGSAAWTAQIVQINLDAESGTTAAAPVAANTLSTQSIASPSATPLALIAESLTEVSSLGRLDPLPPDWALHPELQTALGLAAAIEIEDRDDEDFYDPLDEAYAATSLW